MPVVKQHGVAAHDMAAAPCGVEHQVHERVVDGAVAGEAQHGTTFGGNPLAAAVARVVLRKLSSPEIVANVDRQSRALRDGLAAIDRELNLFAEVRGRGLMLGAVLAPQYAGRAGEILDLAAAEGLLMLQAGPDVLRFVPALNIDDSALGDGLARLARALRAFAK